jgi:hypothetical protein
MLRAQTAISSGGEFSKSYSVKANTDDVWAALFVKESRTVPPGEELTHDYPWVK